MGRKLATYVHIEGRVWGPDDDVPDSVAAQITHPRAWADDSDQAPDDPAIDVDEDGEEVEEVEEVPAARPAPRRRSTKKS